MQTKITQSNYEAETLAPISEITARTIGKPDWAGGAELIALAERFEFSELSADFLAKQIKLNKSWAALDGHNWSAFTKRLVNDQIQFAEFLLARINK